MKIMHDYIKIGSRVRLTEDVEMFDCTYTKGHEFNVYGCSYRGFDLVDDDGNKIDECLFIHDKLELIKESIPRFTKQSVGGTSFFDTEIQTTPAKLKKLFPYSYSEDNTGEDKTNIDFVLETSTGRVFTIYDWKLYRPYNEDEVIDFHIGGYCKEDTELAKRELLNALN